MVVIAVVKVDGTGLSRKSTFDQFVCHFWLARQPIWYFVATSTYGILLTALDRYVAVLYPIWYSNHVRTVFMTVTVIISNQIKSNLLRKKGAIQLQELSAFCWCCK